MEDDYEGYTNWIEVAEKIVLTDEFSPSQHRKNSSSSMYKPALVNGAT